MGNAVKQLCALSVICGAVMTLAPDGNVKKLMNVLCSIALISNLLVSIGQFDYQTYSVELARSKQQEKAFLKSGEAVYENLNRSVIEKQYETYIGDKARDLGLAEMSISITAEWGAEGIWVPYSFETNREYCSELSEYIVTELGIPPSRQQWNKNE